VFVLASYDKEGVFLEEQLNVNRNRCGFQECNPDVAIFGLSSL
jgi:hypothetical protein